MSMERDLVVGRTEAAVFLGAAMESSPSRCSSGCLSGWTLYLDHSDGGQRHLEPGRQGWGLPRTERPADDDDGDDNSMVSDASSGPSPRLLDDDEDEEAAPLRPRGREQRGVDTSSGSIGNWHRSSSSFLQGRATRRPIVVRCGEATATHQYRVEDDDDLSDTASSSAALSICPMSAVAYTAPPAERTSYTMLETRDHACVTR